MRTYPIAFSIAGKSWVNNHAHVLRFTDRNLQTLVEYYLNSISLEQWITGMAQPKLNQKALNSIPVPTTSIEHCGELVAKLDAASVEVERLEAIYQQRAERLSELRQAVLAKTFGGGLAGDRARAA